MKRGRDETSAADEEAEGALKRQALEAPFGVLRRMPDWTVQWQPGSASVRPQLTLGLFDEQVRIVFQTFGVTTNTPPEATRHTFPLVIVAGAAYAGAARREWAQEEIGTVEAPVTTASAGDTVQRIVDGITAGKTYGNHKAYQRYVKATCDGLLRIVVSRVVAPAAAGADTDTRVVPIMCDAGRERSPFLLSMLYVLLRSARDPTWAPTAAELAREVTRPYEAQLGERALWRGLADGMAGLLARIVREPDAIGPTPTTVTTVAPVLPPSLGALVNLSLLVCDGCECRVATHGSAHGYFCGDCCDSCS